MGLRNVLARRAWGNPESGEGMSPEIEVKTASSREASVMSKPIGKGASGAMSSQLLSRLEFEEARSYSRTK